MFCATSLRRTSASICTVSFPCSMEHLRDLHRLPISPFKRLWHAATSCVLVMVDAPARLIMELRLIDGHQNWISIVYTSSWTSPNKKWPLCDCIFCYRHLVCTCRQCGDMWICYNYTKTHWSHLNKQLSLCKCIRFESTRNNHNQPIVAISMHHGKGRHVLQQHCHAMNASEDYPDRHHCGAELSGLVGCPNVPRPRPTASHHFWNTPVSCCSSHWKHMLIADLSSLSKF